MVVFLKECFQKVDFEKIQQTTKNFKNYPVGKELNVHAQLSSESTGIMLYLGLHLL